MDIKELSPIGAELLNVDLTQLSKEDIIHIKRCFLDYSVIVFRYQKLTPKDLKNISKLWGEALVHPVFKGIENHPEIIEIRNYGERYHTNAHWHSDVTFEECPPDATLLYSLEVPEEGGDTLFSSQYLAYEDLDKELKSSLSGKLAIHSNIGVLMLSGGDPKDAKTVEHPVFREHPETGKKALYVTEAFVKSIKDLDPIESQRILKLLYKQASKEEYIYRHKWSNGDLVVWDNRSVQHYAEHGYGDATRTMHRLTTSGSKPF
ncbi:MAG: taurine dioxygenase [Euryarchaeota archaeon]|nr:taurine dioxygenase [Euryarchaeota archaeon]